MRITLAVSLLPAGMLLGGFVTAFSSAGAETFAPIQDDADPPGHFEHPDDPYLKPDRRRGEQRGNPLPGGFSFVQVNVDENGDNITDDAANEPSITLDPANPDRLAIGWRQFDNVNSNFRQSGWGWSDDGGQTWTFPGRIEPGVFRSDPVLDVGPDGTFFYFSLMGDFTCDMFMSDDSGETWSEGVDAFGGDKQWFIIDRTGGIGSGNIYAAWSLFAGCCGERTFIRSTDGGFTYEEPIEVPFNPIWGTLVVDRHGRAFVSGFSPGDFETVIVARSGNAQDPDETVTFDEVGIVDIGGQVTFGGGPNPGGLLGQCWCATDTSDGPHGGNMYVLASVNPSGGDPLDVRFAKSADGGATWSQAITVNDDPTQSWQWFGTMSVSPNGRIDVVWNDTRNDDTTTFSELFHAISTDGGDTWTENGPLTPQWNHFLGHPNQDKIGDYYDMISDNTGAHLAFAATFNGEQDVYYMRIPIAQNAPLTDAEVVFGSLLEGGLDELSMSDDTTLDAQSQPGFLASEANVMEIAIGAAHDGPFPDVLDISVESRLDNPGGIAALRLRNFSSGALDTIDSFQLGMSETYQPFLDVDAVDRVRPADGRIELNLRYIVPATFTAGGFRTFIDLAEINAR